MIGVVLFPGLLRGLVVVSHEDRSGVGSSPHVSVMAGLGKKVESANITRLMGRHKCKQRHVCLPEK
jgi:hypothetical protein